MYLYTHTHLPHSNPFCVSRSPFLSIPSSVPMEILHLLHTCWKFSRRSSRVSWKNLSWCCPSPMSLICSDSSMNIFSWAQMLSSCAELSSSCSRYILGRSQATRCWWQWLKIWRKPPSPESVRPGMCWDSTWQGSSSWRGRLRPRMRWHFLLMLLNVLRRRRGRGRRKRRWFLHCSSICCPRPRAPGWTHVTSLLTMEVFLWLNICDDVQWLGWSLSPPHVV